MLRAFSTLLALALIGLASLVFLPAPNLFFWRLTILATEYGHWLAAISAVLALFTVLGLGYFGLRFMQAVLLLAATAVFSWPTFQAWQRAGSLPSDFASALGTPNGRLPAFDFQKLWQVDAFDENPQPRTETYFVGDGVTLALDFFAPSKKQTNDRSPCVIVVHGGGWDSGDRHQMENFNHFLAERGIAVASIDYRLAPRWRWPAQRDDLLAAIAWLRANAERLGIDAKRVVLLGRSAGAQIAVTTAYEKRIDGVRGVIAFYGPYDLRFAYEHGTEDDLLRSPALIRNLVGGPIETHGNAFDAASAIRFVRRDLPPTLLLHGERDELVWHKQSERLTRELAANNVPHFLLSVPWATHGFDFNPNGPSGQLATWTVLQFLERAFASEAAR